MKKPKILFLVPSDYASLQAKGVAQMIFERDEQGFFEKVITVHPLSKINQTIQLNDIHTLFEFNLHKYLYPNKFSWLLFPFLPIKFLLLTKNILTIIKKEKIDLIRATDPNLMGILGFILSKLARIPFCISLHTNYDKTSSLNPYTGFRKILWSITKRLRCFTLPKAHLVLPIRECYVKQLLEFGTSMEQIRIIPHGIKLDFNFDKDIKTKFNIPIDKKLISFVGRLSKENYIEDMLQAFCKLSQIRNDFILLIVGDGEMATMIDSWLQQCKELQPLVRQLGFQTNEIGRSIRHISDVSLCLCGGFSLIEAAAAASPVIAYDIEWHYELVENFQTGFLIAEHDLNGLIQSLCYLMDHHDEAIAMGQRAQERAYQHHDILKTSQIKKNVYLELLNEATRS